MVILTSSSRLASLSLKSVTLEASTVKILRSPSIFEKVSPLDSRVTSLGAGAGAFRFSRYSTHLRCKYTPPVRLASNKAAPADQRAYRAASLLFMESVKQNFAGVYRRGGSGRRKEKLAGGLSAGCRIRQDSHIRGGHAVAFRVLHQIHGFIRKMQQPFFGA